MVVSASLKHIDPTRETCIRAPEAFNPEPAKTTDQLIPARALKGAHALTCKALPRRSMWQGRALSVMEMQFWTRAHSINQGNAPLWAASSRLVQLKRIMQRLNGQFHVFAIDEHGNLDLRRGDDLNVDPLV